jgi:hypothetical protein
MQALTEKTEYNLLYQKICDCWRNDNSRQNDEWRLHGLHSRSFFYYLIKLRARIT